MGLVTKNVLLRLVSSAFTRVELTLDQFILIITLLFFSGFSITTSFDAYKFMYCRFTINAKNKYCQNVFLINAGVGFFGSLFGAEL